MKMMKVIMVAVAVTGFLSVGLALTASHAIYVQTKVLKSEMASSEGQAKADTLARFADQSCALLGAAGGVQVVLALIGSAILSKTRPRRRITLPNQAAQAIGGPRPPQPEG